MGRSRSKETYKKTPFESDGNPSDVSANIYESMLKSPAFKDLTASQRMLCVYMKARYYGQKRKPYKDDRTSFTFNESVWIKGNPHGYEIYSNKRQFYKDRQALIDHGFIEIAENNKNQRESNVYRYSSEWRTWSKKPP